VQQFAEGEETPLSYTMSRPPLGHTYAVGTRPLLGSEAALAELVHFSLMLRLRMFDHRTSSLRVRHIIKYWDNFTSFSKTGVRFEGFTATTMKNSVVCDVTPCDFSKDRRFGGICCLYHQGDRNRLARNSVNSNKQPKHAAKKYIAPSSPILVNLMMEAIRYSETLVLRRTTRHNIAEDGILLTQALTSMEV
jgi:hypothetical protein